MQGTRVLFFISLLLSGVIVAGDLYAQSARDLDNRLRRLENEIQTMSRAVYRGEQPPAGSTFSGSPASANAEVRIQQLETELRNLTGQLEEQNYKIRQLTNQLERYTSDTNLRLGDIESGAGNGAAGSAVGALRSDEVPNSGMRYTAMGQQQDNESDRVAAVDVSEGKPNVQRLGTLSNVNNTDPISAQYEEAFTKLKNGDYAGAETGFSAFLAANPDHTLASNAKYWLGETYYVRGDYEKAARVFAEGYQKYPEASKAPDNLLKLGISLAGMGNEKDACIALGQLQKDYSGTTSPVMRRADQEIKRLNCSS